MTILAIDHGAVRTGVAVSDPTDTVARPHSVIERVDSPPGMDALLRVVAEVRPERIIVGHPRLMSGEVGSQARAAAGFAGRLRKRVDIPVDLIDERLTTAEATRRSRETGADRRRGAPGIDSLAASVLLEGYLTSLASSEPAR